MNPSATEAADAADKDPALAAKADAAAEAKFIADYVRLTAATETQARSLYMYADILVHRDPYWYHLE